MKNWPTTHEMKRAGSSDNEVPVAMNLKMRNLLKRNGLLAKALVGLCLLGSAAAALAQGNSTTSTNLGTLAPFGLYGPGSAVGQFTHTNYRTNEHARTIFLPRDSGDQNTILIRSHGPANAAYFFETFAPSAGNVAYMMNRGYIQGSSELAQPGLDYVPVSQAFNYGPSGTALHAITIIDDDDVEFNEDIIVRLRPSAINPSLAGSDDVATITIEMDDPPAGANDLEFNADPPYNDDNPNPGANGPVHAVHEYNETVILNQKSFSTNDVTLNTTNFLPNRIFIDNHGFANGTQVSIGSSSTVNFSFGLPNGLQQIVASGANLFVINAANDHFQLTTSLIGPGGGPAVPINFTSHGEQSAVPFYVTEFFRRRAILIGGDFTSVNQVSRNRLAKLSTDGSLHPDFSPGTGADGFVDDIALQPDEKIILVGGFTSFNGFSREGVVRLNTDGSVDTTFNPGTGFNGITRVAEVVTNGVARGKIMIGGEFTEVNSTNRNYLARLNPDGALDASFETGTGPNGPVYAIKAQIDGKIVIAGDFTSYNGTARNRVARINPNGTLDLSFDPGAGVDDVVYDLELDSRGATLTVDRTASGGPAEDRFTTDTGANEGTVIVNYDFLTVPDSLTIYYDNQQIFATGLTNGIGTVEVPFGPGNSTEVEIVMNEGSGLFSTLWQYSLSIVPKGIEKPVIVGAFNTVDFRSRNGIARLNSDGTLDESFSVGRGFDDTVFSVEQQPDGRFILGGIFHSFNQVARTNLARIFQDGALDTSFMDTAYNQQAGVTNNSPIIRSHINDLAIQPDGNVVIGGSFTEVGGTHGRLGHGIEVGGRQFIGTPLGVTWPDDGLNAVDDPLDHQFAGTGFVRPRQLGGTGGTRWGLRTRRNFARVHGGNTENHFGEHGGPGNLGFVRTSYSEDENGTNVVMQVTRTNGRLATATITMRTIDETATSGADYQGLVDTRTWVARHGFQGLQMFGSSDLTNKLFSVPILDDPLVEGDETFDIVLENPVSSLLLPDNSVFNIQSVLTPTNVAIGVAVASQGSAKVTLFDNDFAFGVFDFSVTNYFIDEAAGEAVITVNRTDGGVGNVSVQYSTIPGGSADVGLDYVGVTNTLSFGPGQTSRVFRIPIISDTEREFDQTIHMILDNPNGGATLGSRTFATVTILDDDFGTGTISLSTNTYSVTESSGVATVTLKRTSGERGAVDVVFRTVDNTAFSGVDYVGVLETITFANGETEKTVDIPILDDTAINGDVVVDLEIVSVSQGASIGVDGRGVIEIANDDFYGSLQFLSTDFFVNEDAGKAVITVVRVGGSAEEVSASISIGDPFNDTASVGSDYQGIAMATVTFPGGITQQSIEINIASDVLVEPEETISLVLNNLDKATPGDPLSATLTIVDTDSLHRPAGSDDTFFDSGLGPDNFVFATEIQDDRRILLGGAFDSVNGTFLSKVARLDLSGAVDTGFDPGEGANGVVNGMALQPDGRIIFVGGFDRYSATNRSGIVRVMKDGSVDTTFNPGAGTDNPVLDIALNTNGTAVVVGEFTTYNGVGRNRVALIRPDGFLEQSFNPGTGADARIRGVAIHTNGAHSGKVVVVGDFVNLDGRTVNRVARLNLSDGSIDEAFRLALNAGVTNGAVHAVAIQPTDGKIVIGGVFSHVNGVPRSGIARLNADGSVDLTFDPGAGVDNTALDLALQEDGKVVAVGDFTTFDGVTANRIVRLNPDGSLDPYINFGTGANNFIASVSVQKDGRLVIGGGFTEFNRVARPYVARIIGGANDGPQERFGELDFLHTDIVVTENAASVEITVIRSRGLEGELNVGVTIDGGTAVNGTDFTALGTTTITFPHGESLQTLSIPLIDDTIGDPFDKTILLRLTDPRQGVMAPDPALLGPDATATVTISEDDSLIGFAANSFSLAEGEGVAVITVERVGGATGPASVGFITVEGTATSGVDYTPVTNTLSFAAGEVRKSFGVPLLDDQLVEGEEALTLLLMNEQGATTIDPDRASVPLVIVDDDLRTGELNFSASKYTIDENGGSIEITVLRTNGVTGTISVDYATRDGLAIAGPDKDYTATSGVLTFADGVTNRTFVVEVNGNEMEAEEKTENVVLLLSNPRGGAVLGGRNTANLEILNNDGFLHGAFSFEFVALDLDEGVGTHMVKINRTGGTTRDVKVDLAIVPGTATPGLDYQDFAPITFEFLEGETQMEHPLTIFDENPRLFEGDETLFLTLSNPTRGSSLGANPTMQVNITENDDDLNGVFAFSEARFNVNETAGVATITVVRTNGVFGAVSVDFATSAGTATPGEDYTDVSGTLNFADQQDELTFDVPISHNPAREGFFTVNLALSAATGGAAIGQTSATLVLIDNEAAAGSQDDSFAQTIGADATVYSVAEFAPTGKLTIGGDFQSFNGISRANVARLNMDGTLDTLFDAGGITYDGTNATVRSVSLVTNGVHIGKVIIGGRFDQIGGTNRFNIARLNENGSIDPTFDTGTGPNGFVHAVLAQNDGRIVIGGDFTLVDGVERNHIARLNDDGSLDLSFNPGYGANNIVRTLAVDAAGFVVVGGDFTEFDGVAAGSIVRLRTDGSVDKTFNPGTGANGSVYSIDFLGDDGSVVLGGEFTAVNGETRMAGVALLNSDGSLAANFDTAGGPNGLVHTVAVDASRDDTERIFIGGGFNSVGSVTNLNRIVRLNQDGSLDSTFNIGRGVDGIVTTSLIQGDGTVVIGGGFSTVDGIAHNRIARLHGGENIGPGNLNFASAAYTVAENAVFAEVAIIRTRGLTGRISVDYATSNGSALESVNYTGVSGTLVFEEGETLKNIVIPVIDNSNPFGDKTVNLSLSNSQQENGMGVFAADPNLLIEPSASVLTILDNDGVVGFESAFFAVTENETNATISVVRAGGAIEPLTVDFAVSDGTANVIVDYIATNGTLSFSNGQRTATFQVGLFDDTKIERTETVNLTLSNLVGNAILSQRNAELRIVDNEFSPGFIRFDSVSYATNENAGEARIRIERVHGANGVASANFATTNGTATAGLDFTHVEQPVTFADGETEQFVNVPIVDEVPALVEGDETVNLTLLGAQGALLSGFAPFGELNTNFNVGFDPLGGGFRGPNGPVLASEVQQDGRILVAGAFNTWVDSNGSTPVRGIVRVLANGELDLTFNPGFGANGQILDIYVQPDQNIVLAGSFTSFNTNTHNRIVRLLPSGTIDTNYMAGTGANGTIRSIEHRTVDGRLLIGGDFTQFDGTDAQRVALLNANGTLNGGLNTQTGANGPVFAVLPHTRVLENSGALDFGAVIAGGFTSYGGTNNVVGYARLLQNGNLDTNFQSGGVIGGPFQGIRGGSAFALDDMLDGRIVLGGSFNNIANAAYNGVARLLPNGALDNTFNIGSGADTLNGFQTSVLALAITPATNVLDQKILVGGNFRSFNGVNRNRIERLNFDGARDTNFEPCWGFDGPVFDFTLQVDEQLIVGGNFTMFSGQTILNLARLQPGLALGLAMSSLTIVDNDIELGFGAPTYTVSESATNITLNIGRLTRTNETVSALVRTQDGTTPATAAAAGFDYTELSAVLTFNPGETNKTVVLDILPDTLIEGDEELSLIVESPDASTTFVGNTAIPVIIADDDTSADLAVLKMATADPIYKGQKYTYTIIVTNAGPATLNGVSLVDQLPAEVTLDPGSLSIPGDLNVAGFVSFDLGQITNGGSQTVSFDVTAPNAAGTVANTAGVSALEFQNGSGATDPDLSNNAVTLVTTIRDDQSFMAPAGAQIVSESKAPANGAIDPGELVSLTLNLRNAGNLPTAGDIEATLVPNANITPSGTTTQNYGAMAVGNAPVGRDFQFTANGAAGEVINVMLQISEGGNVRTDNTVVFPFVLGSAAAGTNSATIAIIEKGEALPYPASVDISGAVGYVNNVALTLSNFTHSFPDDVDILLVGPTGQGVIVMSDVGGGDDILNLTLTIDDQAALALPDGGPLTAGTYRPANYTTRDEAPDEFPSPAPSGTFGDRLSDFNGSDPNGTWSLFVVDDSRLDTGSIAGGWSLDISTVFAVDPPANLGLSVVPSTNAVTVGADLTYTLDVVNLGPETATNVILEDTLPANTTFVSASGGGVAAGGKVTWALGDIARDATASVTLTIRPNASGTLTNGATVSADQPDPAPRNNSVVTTVTVNGAADLALTGVGNIVTLDSDLRFVFTVTNNGPLAAPSVLFDGSLPAGLSSVAAQSSRGLATVVNSGRVTATLGTLASGGTATITITARASATGVFAAQGSVTSGLMDPDAANNTAVAATTTVSEAADVAVTLTNTPSRVIEGERLVYTIGVTNNGPSTAANVILTDVLEAGTFVAADSSPECVFAGGVVTCSLGALPVGTNVVVTIALDIPPVPGAQPDIDNVVTVATTTNDTDASNNAAMVTTAVLERSNNVGVNVSLLSESNVPANNAVDPQETVVVGIALDNLLNTPIADLNVTLQASGGIANPVAVDDASPYNPSGTGATASYGVLNKSDGAKTKNFEFLADGERGETIAATFELRDGVVELGVIVVRFRLNEDSVFASAMEINIPGDQSIAGNFGPAGPYPSEIVVPMGMLAGEIVKATVTVSDLSHSFPDDINMLLVGPTGANVMLMSDVGGGVGLTGVTLTFDDQATASLPDSHSPSISTGAYKPTNVTDSTEASGIDVFPADAPAGPYGTTLGVFTGTDPAGTWKLYIYDDQGHDHGAISGGWSLNLTTLVGINNQVTLSLPGAMDMADPGQPLQISVAGRVGVTYVLEASADLQSWTPVATNKTMNGVVTFQDTQAAGQDKRFYRTSEK